MGPARPEPLLSLLAPSAEAQGAARFGCLNTYRCLRTLSTAHLECKAAPSMFTVNRSVPVFARRYEWVLVQVHTVDELDGREVAQPHLPHRLVATNSAGPTTC